MASVHSSIFQGNETDLASREARIHRALGLLPDNYTVFHALALEVDTSYREIDFLIFDGSQCLLAVEVIGGDDVLDDKERLDDSCHQASTTIQALKAFLGDKAQKLNLGWVLALPDVRIDDAKAANLGPEIPAEAVMDASALKEIETAIDRAEKYYISKHNKPGLEPEEFGQLVTDFKKKVEADLFLTQLAREAFPLIKEVREELAREEKVEKALSTSSEAVLDLSDKQISDISFLSDRKKLKILKLANNKISDLTPLAKLKNLEVIELHGNLGIKDLTPLYILKKLQTLSYHDLESSEIRSLKKNMPYVVTHHGDEIQPSPPDKPKRPRKQQPKKKGQSTKS
jgi:hypothetical protein